MLTQARLQELVIYYPDSGSFYSRTSRGSIKAFSKIGTNHRGYLYTKIEGTRYPLHRLAFLYMTGVFPENQVDHKNGNKSDNSWCNLRDVTRSQNIQNTGPRSNNILGVKNVTQLKDTKKYQVIVNGKSYGCYVDLELAELVATEVRNKLHGEYARHA